MPQGRGMLGRKGEKIDLISKYIKLRHELFEDRVEHTVSAVCTQRYTKGTL